MVPGGDNPGAKATGSLGARLLWTGRFAARRLSQPRFPFRSPVAIERAQCRRGREMARYAHQHVPYYRETMDRLGLRPGEIRTAEDLGRLPLIDREQLQRDPLYFVSHEQPLDRYLNADGGGAAA